ncbi:MAG: hypothetical protein HQL17_01095 [Candidatus Omnitrophica bacterium]|nr:hypothetical protein [Candidatus Omnitrophota bacterium]
MGKAQDDIQKNNTVLFDLALRVDNQGKAFLEQLNHRELRLFNLATHQRVFLFILTRSLKTYSSIRMMCQEGFGQDVSTLQRSLLENLITARYLLHDRLTQDELAKRFVTYKWIILRRHLLDEEKDALLLPPEEQLAFTERRQTILEKAEEFKRVFNVVSDRALVTWSGKTVRDMARAVDKELLDEYGKNFRMCSRFSHPGILGDQEYMIHDGTKLEFSPLPSEIGIRPNLMNAVGYALSFLKLTCALFNLDGRDQLAALGSVFEDQRRTQSPDLPQTASAPQDKNAPSIRESIVVFKTQP